MSTTVHATIRMGSKSLTVNKTSAFTISGRQYSGVVLLGAGTELVVEQSAAARGNIQHTIKTTDGMYLTLVPASPGLPADVKRLIGSAKQFMSTSKSPNKVYLVTTTAGSANTSTVDIIKNASKVYIGVSVNFWMNTGAVVMSAPRRGAATTFCLTSGGGGAATVKAATPTAAVANVAKTVVVEQPKVAPGSVAMSVGDTIRGMPYDNANMVSPVCTPTPFDFSKPVAKISSSALGFGTAVGITADSKTIAVSSNAAISIYTNDIPTPKLRQTINGEKVGRTLRVSHDASVIAFDSSNSKSSEIIVYVFNAGKWAPAPVQNLPSLKTSSDLGSVDLEMSSDGSVIAVCGNTNTKALIVAEDTSAAKNWSTANTVDLTSAVKGGSVLNVALSPDGQWLYVASGPSTIELFRRDKCGIWANMSMIIVSGYPGIDIKRMITSFGGALLMVADYKGLIALRRINDSTLALFPPMNGKPVDPAVTSQLAATAHFTTLMMTTDSPSVVSVSRLAGGFSDVATYSENAVLSSIAVSASGVHPMVVAGSPSNGEVRVYWQGLTTNEAHVMGERLLLGSSASSPMMEINSTSGVYLGGDLFLNGRMTDPMEAGSVDHSPEVGGADSNPADVTYVADDTSKRYIEWYRNGNCVRIQGSIQWKDMMEGGGGAFRATTSKPWPAPSNIGGGIYGTAWFASGADVLGASIAAKVVSTNTIEFYELAPTGGSVPIDAGTDTMAPHVLDNGHVTFSVTFLTTTS